MSIYDKLETFSFIIKNKYLQEYISFLKSYTLAANSVDYTENHHIICKAFFKYINEPIDDSPKNLIALKFKDHCYVHWLLYKCTTGQMQEAMANSFISMIAMKKSNSLLELGLTPSEYDDLQQKINKIKNDSSLNYWTAQDLEFLQKYYPIKGERYCAERLSRTLAATRGKANDLGLTLIKWWTIEEEQFLKDNFIKFGFDYCCSNLSKEPKAILNKIYRLGLASPKDYSLEEVNFLIENYAIFGPTYCAKYLNRTYVAIKRKARTLGLKCSQGTPIYCETIDKYFESIKEASKKLGVSDGNICSVLHGRLKTTNGYSFKYVDKEEYLKKLMASDS